MNAHPFARAAWIGALGLLLQGLAPAFAAPQAARALTAKKGVAAAKFGPGNVAAANASWYYNWRYSPNSGSVPAGTAAPEYVPMLSKAADVTDQNVAALTAGRNNGTYKYLLGFNEPDLASQANMTVAQAIGLWPKYMATGLALGSPAPTNPNAWFDDFLAQAQAKGYRVDFICLHYYRPPNSATAVADLKKWLTDAYAKYKKPIWLTEFGAPDCKSLGWCGSNAAALTQAQVDAFVGQVVAMLESLPFVERYAWFVDRTQEGFELSFVFNADGSLSPTGTALRNAPASTIVDCPGAAGALLAMPRPGLFGPFGADGRTLRIPASPRIRFAYGPPLAAP
jgi:hypothetical protein